MFTPTTFGIALLMMIVSATCWGSWANTYKGVKNYRFELFYWDYAIGIFLAALIYALTMGSTTNGPTSFLNNVRSADLSNIGWALLAGIIFNLANLLLVAAIDMAGFAIAFPVAIGIALVVGTVLSFVQQQRGNVTMLGAGVLCAVVAVILDGKAYGELGTNREASRKSIIVCVISGVLMGSVGAVLHPRANPRKYSGPLQHRRIPHRRRAAFLPLVEFVFHEEAARRRARSIQWIFPRPVNGHVLGLLGGAIWTTGTVFNLVAANYTGVAISYSIGQSAPMVAALWGIFVWKEFAGANKRAMAYLALMFVFYFLAILLIARANTAG